MALIIFILLFIFGVLTSIVQAFVATHLWAWFIVPTFGLAQLGLVPAMGITLLISLLFKPRDTEDSGDMGEVFERSGRKLVASIVYSVMALGVGYLYQLFM